MIQVLVDTNEVLVNLDYVPKFAHLLVQRNFIAVTFHYIVWLENSGFTTYFWNW